MIKKLSFLLICVHILCAENFAESSAESTQNAIVDSAKSTNPPPQSQNAESKI